MSPAGGDPGWGTWDVGAPSGVSHPGAGLEIRVSAFSAKANIATSFPPSPEVRFGPRLPHAYAEAGLAHADSTVLVRWAPDGDELAGAIEVDPTGEWGLRFWFTLEVGLREGQGRVWLVVPEGEAAYVDPPTVLCSLADGRTAAVRPDLRPVVAHHYEDRTDVLRELERHGYYHRPEPRPDGRWAILRYTAVTPRVGLAAAIAPDEGGALDRLEGAPPDSARILDVRRAEAVAERPIRAAQRDVIGWNTVWDRSARRSYTTATRAWVEGRFGGSIVWQIDAFVHVVMAARLGDEATTRANLEAALACRVESGMLAALRSPATDWVDRSHPPLGGQATWLATRAFGADDLLERSLPVLARAYRWWFEARDGNGDGLLEYGSTPVGDGHFVHTKLAAMDESAMDNSPVHDELAFDAATHTLDGADVGLNALLVHEAELLASAARRLGRDEEASGLEDASSAHAERIRRTLWDDDRGIYANRRWDGRFVRSVSPMSFAPMMAGIATPGQAERMVREWLARPERFGGDHPVAGTPHEDPASHDNVYWRGRVWPPLNWIVYRGLRRMGFDEAAASLALAGWAMFERHWTERRSFENLNQRTGRGDDSPDSDHFYTWGALLATIADCDLAEIDPVHGLCVGSPASTGRTRLSVEGSALEVDVRGDGSSVRESSGPSIDLGARGVWRDLRLTAEGLRVATPSLDAPARVRVPWEVSSATTEGRPIEAERGNGDGWVVSVPGGPAGREVQVARRPLS